MLIYILARLVLALDKSCLVYFVDLQEVGL